LCHRRIPSRIERLKKRNRGRAVSDSPDESSPFPCYQTPRRDEYPYSSQSVEASGPGHPVGRGGPDAPARLGQGWMRVARFSTIDPPGMDRRTGRSARFIRPPAFLLGAPLLAHILAADRGDPHASTPSGHLRRASGRPDPLPPIRRLERASHRPRSDRASHGSRATALSPTAPDFGPLRPRWFE
jgi:hypothetical protein